MAQRRRRTTGVSPRVARGGVNQRLLDETLQHRIRLEALANGLAQRWAQGLDRGALEEVVAIIARSIALLKTRGPVLGGRRSPLTTKTLAEVHRRSGEVLRQGLDLIQRELRAELRDLARSEGLWLQGAVNSSLPSGLPPSVALNAPHGQTLRAVVDQTLVLGRPIPEWFAGISASTGERIRARLNQGLVAGESLEGIIRGIRGTRANGFRDGLLQAPKRHVETLVRTSMTSVTQAARELTARENDDLIQRVQWVSTLDARTTDICFDGATRVSAVGSAQRVFRRAYQGEVCVVRTAAAQQFRATPNHPVLTSRGWLPAQELQPGRDVLYRVSGDGLCVRCREDVGVPPTFAELANAVFEGSGVEVRTKRSSAADFHGDGVGSKSHVSVARPDRHLGHGAEATLAEALENDFLRADHSPALLFALRGLPLEDFGRSPADVAAKLNALAPESFVDARLGASHCASDGARLHSRSEQRKYARDLLGVEAIGLPAFAGAHDSVALQERGDGGGGHPKMPCYRCRALAVSVSSDRVVDVRTELWTGHVYNLQCQSGYYLANGHVVKNCMSLDGRVFLVGEGQRPPAHHQCRSDIVYVTRSWEDMGLPFEELTPTQRASMNGYVPATESYPTWFARQPQDFQQMVLGPKRFEVYQRGLVPLDRFVARDLRSLTLPELEALEAGIRSGSRSAAPFVLPGQVPKGR